MDILHQKLLKHKDITAIFAGMMPWRSDAIRRSMNWAKIPEDISVIGFDGLKLSEYMIPQLTTVQQPSFDIGFYAARFLIDTIEFPQRKVPEQSVRNKINYS